MENAKIG